MNTLAACQRPGGAFLKDGIATVLTCIPTPTSASETKKKGKSSSSVESATQTYDVTLSDTVLFPGKIRQSVNDGNRQM